MHAIIANIVAELKGSWRFRWAAIVVAWISCVMGWVLVLGMPDTYESYATVYVNTNSPLWDSLEGIVSQDDVLKRVEVEAQALMGRPEVERIVREVDLHLQATSNAQLDVLVERVRSNVRITNNPRIDRNMYRIGYRDVEPEIAERVVRSLLNSFVEGSLGGSRDDTAVTREFLSEQIAKLAAELDAAELELAEFKRKNVGKMPGEGGGYFDRLQSIMSSRDGIVTRIRLAERRRDALQQQLSGDRSGSEIELSPQSEIDQRISTNKTRLEELRLRYTDLHPDVIATLETIEQLEAQKEAALNDLAESGGIGAMSDNPVMQNIQIELTNVNVEIATLNEELASHNQRIKELEELIDVLPQIEAELASLTRGYDDNQSRHRALLDRLGDLNLKDQASQREDVKFRVIEPPIVPDNPVAPNRPLLLAIVLVGGLGLGGAAAFLMNQVKPVFSSPTILRDLTELPVLGTVQVMRTLERKRWRNRQIVSVTAGVISLCFVFVFLLIFSEQGSQIVQSAI